MEIGVRTYAVVVMLLSVGPRLTLSQASECRVLALKRAGADVTLEALALPNDSARAFAVSEVAGVLALLTPVGIGHSSTRIDATRPKLFRARCTGGELHVQTRETDGVERVYPPVRMIDLAAYELRVNIVWKTGQRVFLVRGMGPVEIDSVGPLVDVFDEVVPDSQSVYTLSTETTRRWQGRPARGEVELRYVREQSSRGGHLLAAARIGGGPTGHFVFDVAAGKTVVARSFLPPATAIEQLSSTVFTEQGTRMVPPRLSGAGGEVAHLLGSTRLAALQVGGVVFDSAEVLVLDSLSTVNGVRVDGILGLDLLLRAGRASWSYPRSRGLLTILRLGDSAAIDVRRGAEVPFSLASGHVFVKGRLRGVDVDLILDTGSPVSFLADRSARESQVGGLRPAGEVIGLDGAPIQVRLARGVELELGGETFRGVSFHVAELPVFPILGIRGRPGLLGNDFLSRFRTVEIDFARRRLRLGY
jgi:hypothetical protein